MGDKDAEAFELKKPEVAETRLALQTATNTRDAKKMMETIQRVISYTTMGVDMSPLYPDMIKVCCLRIALLLLFLFKF